MNILIVSAANVLHAKHVSTSLKTSEVICNLLNEQTEGAVVKTIQMVDLELKPCIMCGKCHLAKWNCVFDTHYNHLLGSIRQADAVFFVIPYYAPIPSKMSIVLEKVQEMCFIQMCIDKTQQYFLKDKIAALVVHGGSPKEYLSTYRSNLLDPIAAALRGVGMRVVGVDADWPSGVAFGVTGFKPAEDSIFPCAVHDWDDVRETIAPLVSKVLSALDKERA